MQSQDIEKRESESALLNKDESTAADEKIKQLEEKLEKLENQLSAKSHPEVKHRSYRDQKRILGKS